MDAWAVGLQTPTYVYDLLSGKYARPRTHTLNYKRKCLLNGGFLLATFKQSKYHFQLFFEWHKPTLSECFEGRCAKVLIKVQNLLIAKDGRRSRTHFPFDVHT